MAGFCENYNKTFQFHKFQDIWSRQFHLQAALKMELIGSPETSVNNYQ
jgi:hypothetical protein